MGASESAPASPACRPPLSRHLAHVRDPRSPTAGILRTPIEVESCPRGSPGADPGEEGLADDGRTRGLDPRSPTPGISRTPMKAVLADTINNLVKQLSEAFAATAAEEEPLPEEPFHRGQKSEEGSREEASAGEASWKEKEGQEPLAKKASVTAVPRAVAKPSGALGLSGSKPVRCRPSSKILAASTSSVRSPLSILQDDNSPSPLASQGKRRAPAADPQGERKEGLSSSGRALKAGSYGWGCSLNKENQQRHLVEN